MVVKVKQFCPYCKSTLKQIYRTPTDRLASLLTGFKRYQCEHDFCGWEGKIHVSRT